MADDEKERRDRMTAQVECLFVGSAFLFVVALIMMAGGDRSGAVWAAVPGIAMCVLAAVRADSR